MIRTNRTLKGYQPSALTAMTDLNMSTVIISGGAVGNLDCFKMSPTRFTRDSSIQPRRYDMSTAITCVIEYRFLNINLL